MRALISSVVLLSVCSLTGCFFGYAPEDLYKTVAPWGTEPGVYSVYLYVPEMQDEYWQDIDDLYDPAAYEGVLRYLEEKELIPDECVNGIVVFGVYGARHSIGSALFRCK